MTNLLRVRAVGQGWSGGPGLMTFYFSGSTSPTGSEAVEAAARVRACLNGAAAVIPIGVTWQVSGSCDVIDDATGNLVANQSNTDPAVVTGTGSGGQAPPAVAALVRFTTGGVINGRRLAGRRYHSPLPFNALATTGVLSATAQSTLVSAYGLLVVQITTPITHRVWHRPGPLGPGSSSASTSNSTPAKLAQLKSRRD